jgi:hypothetical protein
MWAGKYKALVDGEMRSREDEEALRYHEMENYEAVWCRIWLKRETVADGLTFGS